MAVNWALDLSMSDKIIKNRMRISLIFDADSEYAPFMRLWPFFWKPWEMEAWIFVIFLYNRDL